MEVQYVKQHSPSLNKDMEWKIYGHGGRPVLFISCQDGRFFDFENSGQKNILIPIGVSDAMSNGLPILQMSWFHLCGRW